MIINSALSSAKKYQSPNPYEEEDKSYYDRGQKSSDSKIGEGPYNNDLIKCSFVSNNINLFEQKSYDDLRIEESITEDKEL